MSISASHEKTVKKSSSHHHHHDHHRRNKSGDLDVFEAARYFSANINADQKNHHQSIRGGRISLDVPVRSLLTQETDPPTVVKQQQQLVKEKKHSSGRSCRLPKPSSPGARLTNFLNSIFNQAGKKTKSKSVKDHEDEEEESPGGRRRRPRSSISHFRCSSTSDAAKSYRNYFGNYNSKAKQSGSQDGDQRDRHNTTDLSWLDEKLKLIESYSATEKQKRLERHIDHNNQYLGRKETVTMRRSVEVDDEGADIQSDSSSDLFELENCDLGLPVYETTNMDDIKRGASIAAACSTSMRI